MEINVTNSEWYLLQCLWAESPKSLMQLVAELGESVGWSKSTCATMVRRMTEKGLIAYKEQGKTKQFFALVEKEDIVVQETHHFLRRIYNGSIGMMMNTLVEQNKLSDSDIRELQEILDRAKSQCKK